MCFKFHIVLFSFKSAISYIFTTPTTSDNKPATCDNIPATGDNKLATCDQQTVTCD